MRKFIVERPLPNIGDATREEQLSMAKVSDEIIERLGVANIRWVESIFAADKAYCFYYARDLETVREHSRIGGFPYDSISRSASFWIRAVRSRPMAADPPTRSSYRQAAAGFSNPPHSQRPPCSYDGRAGKPARRRPKGPSAPTRRRVGN